CQGLSENETRTNYEKFIKIFYQTRNSLNESDFERCWKKMIKQFPQASNYLQSSQRIEALNALLKMGVDHMSSLCHLHEECQRLFDNQAQYSQLEEYQNSVPTRGLLIASQVIFPQIDSILIKFVTSHILSIQRQQMNELLLYRVARLEVSEFNNNELESDIPDSNFTEDLNDYPRIPLSSLLENVNYNDVKEIWQIKGIITP
ncbi:24258_t:CDS:2, partial [Gigaspora margarita]